MATVRFFISVSILLCFNVNGLAQLVKVTTLDRGLNEVSGMASDGKYIWMINDSGNAPLLYEFEGSEYRGAYTILAENIDWEAITTDIGNNLYIGDLGSNSNDRNSRQIYRIPRRALDHKYDTIQPESWNIQIPFEIPPTDHHLDFDWESLLYYNGALHTFSKNRREPFDGELVHFKLLDLRDSSTTAEIIDSTNLGGLLRKNSWITDATLSRDRRHLFLLSSDKLTAYLDFPDDHFFEGHKVTIPFHHISQKESIVAWNDSVLLIADERHPQLGGRNLYALNLTDLLDEYERERTDEVNLHSEDFDTILTFTVDPLVESAVSIEIFNSSGKVMIRRMIGQASSGTVTDFSVNTSDLPIDNYILNIRVGPIPHGFFLRKKYNPETQDLPLDEKD